MTYDDYGDELAGLLHRGKLSELRARSREIVEQFRIVFGEQNVQTARAIGGLAFACYEIGEWDAAAAHWSRACQVHLAIFGEYSPQYVQSLCDVARADLLAGRIDKAESLVDQAGKILPSIPGDHRFVMIEFSILLARIRLRRKATAAAEEVLLEAARLRLRQLEGEYGRTYNWVDRILSDVFACLALVYAHQRDLRAASSTMQKAIRIRQPEFDTVYPYYARMLSTLGAIQFRLGDVASARASQLKAIEILSRIRPSGHFDIEMVAGRLAKTENREKHHNANPALLGEQRT